MEGKPPTSQVHRDGLRWEVVSALEPSGLLDGIGHGEAEAAGTILKRGQQCVVYRRAAADQTVVVKHHTFRGWKDLGRRLFRPSPARREWTALGKLRERGIAAPRPLAVGQRSCCGLVRDSFLITEHIEDAAPLDRHFHSLQDFPASVRSLARRELLLALAAFTAQLHDAGITHEDLHPGNLMVRRGAPGSAAEFVLLDAPDVRMGRPLDAAQTKDSLARLMACGLEQTTAAERWRFWRRYLRHRNTLTSRDPRRMAAAISAQAEERHVHTALQRDKRIVRTNRSYYTFREGGYCGHAVRELLPGQIIELIEQCHLQLRDGIRGIPVHQQAAALCELQVEVHGVPQTCSCQSFPTGWRTRRHNQNALAAWTHGQALAERGVSVPRPLMVWTDKAGQGYLMTQLREGLVPLSIWCRRLVRHRDRPQLSLQTARALGTLLGQLHAWQIRVGKSPVDCLAIREAAGSVVAYVVDPAGFQLLPRLSEREAVRDVAGLLRRLEVWRPLIRQQVLRANFARCYLHARRKPAHDWQSWWPRLQPWLPKDSQREPFKRVKAKATFSSVR